MSTPELTEHTLALRDLASMPNFRAGDPLLKLS